MWVPAPDVANHNQAAAIAGPCVVSIIAAAASFINNDKDFVRAFGRSSRAVRAWLGP